MAVTTKIDRVRDATIKALRKAQGAPVLDFKGPAGAMDTLPSGIDVLDGHIIGVGGWPAGRIVEVYGPEGSGKSSIALSHIAAVQRMGGLGVLMETEHAFSPDRARVLGVNLDTLVMVQPDTLEDVLSTAEMILGTVPDGHPLALVWDSVAGTPTRAEAEHGVVPDGEGMAEYARVMSRALRVMTGKVARKRAVLTCVNQVRVKPGVSFGNPETTPGGNALKFYCSMRVSISPGTAVKDLKTGAGVVGKDLLVSAVKNKVATPFRSARVRLRVVGDVAFDNVWSTVNFAKDCGALPEGAKVTPGNRDKALAALKAVPGWCAPLHPAPLPGAAGAPEHDPDDVPEGQ